MGGGNLCINMLGEGGGRWPDTTPGGGPAGGGKGPSSAELGPARQPCSSAPINYVLWPCQQIIGSYDLPPIESHPGTLSSWTG